MAPLFQFSGVGSGLDTIGLVNALIDQKRNARIVPKENQILDLEATGTAFKELKSLMLNVRKKAEAFRLVNGGGVSKKATSSDESVLTAAAGSGAQRGSYDLTVSSLAANGKGSLSSSATTYGSGFTPINGAINDGAPAADRTVSITTGTGANAETVDVEITSTTTLSQFVESFNSQSDSATASLVNTGTAASPSYQVLISADESGTDKGSVAFSVGTEVATAGSGAFDTTTISQATNAEFSIAGIAGTISRSTNSISDVIEGVTFNLQSTGTAQISIDSDPEATGNSMEELVDAINQVINFVKENSGVITSEEDGEKKNVFGPLRKSSIDNNAVSAIRSALSSAGLSGQAVSIVAELGITTARDGTLSFDREVFDEAVRKNPDDVTALVQNVGENLGKIGGAIDQFTRFNGLIDSAINSNASRVESINRDILRFETALKTEKEALTRRFARIDALIGTMQAQQSQLSGILDSLNS